MKTLKCASERLWIAVVIGLLLSFFASIPALGQTDQGTITGTISDPSGAVIPNATVTLTNTDTGLVATKTTDASGVYTFSPIKIGNYKVSATAPSFSTTTQQNLHLDVQQRLAVNIELKAGQAAESIEVTAAPTLLQTEEASVGQVMSSRTINETPLSGRNWVFIAQLSAGVTPSAGSRGAGKGDFEANGQRAEQNNFILDGVDNNNNVVDFLNGSSYIVRPPPDALSEFKVQTGNYSAELGHSAGAVINAALKSGTNQIHGNLWEYVRNDMFNARDWTNNAPGAKVPKYRQNQFGATLGFPIIRDKLFFFGDAEATRIVLGATPTLTVPTALMRQGNFSELLSPSFTGTPNGIQLYEPSATAAGTVPVPGNNLAADPNVKIDPVAKNILNLYPLPNINSGTLANNYLAHRNLVDNTWQFDTRMDWNVSSKDQAFSRYSYVNEPGNRPGPLGSVLDGGNFSDDGKFTDVGQNFALSETHIFTPTVTNEFRFGYNWGHFGFLQPNGNVNVAPTIGLGGIPFGPRNGGLPRVNIGGISSFGSPTFYVSDEFENVWQVLDNVTKVAANHSLKFGVSFQNIRFSTEQPTQSRGSYSFSGTFTGKPGTPNTGSGVADFLTNNMSSAALSNLFLTDDQRWDYAAYGQDDWKVNSKLTLNLGLRWEFPTSYRERHNSQAAFIPSSLGVSTGQAVYLIPIESKNVPLASKFLNLLAKDNIALQYSNNPRLIEQDWKNFAPRIGFGYRLTDRTVVRGGFGIFYGGLESAGYFPNLGENFPFEFDSNFPTPSGCSFGGSCPNNGFTLENGFANAINTGLFNAISTPTLRGSVNKVKTPYSEQYNLSLETGITNNMAATVSYVGSVGRHLMVFADPNSPFELVNPQDNSNKVRPFPDFSGSSFTNYSGVSSYNSLQTKLERRFGNGLSFLGTYTYSHSLDDAPTPLGSTGDAGYRNPNIIPIGYDYSNSPFDTRHRVTFNGNYELPFGRGRRYASQSGVLDAIVGGWSSSLTFTAQTGNPFTVGTSGFSGPGGAGSRAILVGDPTKGGGSPVAGNPNFSSTSCPAHVQNTTNWYNPCAFSNPSLSGNIIAKLGTTPGPGQVAPVTSANLPLALQFLGGRRNSVYGPGFERVNMSLFKDFHIYQEHTLQFRADAFNVLNTPSYGQPSNTGIGAQGGKITGSRNFGAFTPDARFFQFALKYSF